MNWQSSTKTESNLRTLAEELKATRISLARTVVALVGIALSEAAILAGFYGSGASPAVAIGGMSLTVVAALVSACLLLMWQARHGVGLALLIAASIALLGFWAGMVVAVNRWGV